MITLYRSESIILSVYSQTGPKRQLNGSKKCGLLTQVNYSEKSAFEVAERAVSLTQVAFKHRWFYGQVRL